MARNGSDLLRGWRAIAEHLDMTAEGARHLARSSDMPTFKLGGTVCARRISINEWLAEREAAGRKTASEPLR